MTTKDIAKYIKTKQNYVTMTQDNKEENLSQLLIDPDLVIVQAYCRRPDLHLHLHKPSTVILSTKFKPQKFCQNTLSSFGDAVTNDPFIA
jgi:ribulose-5-phosphate 4-epimerase/fuculose-1-phosphate aldolase